MKKFLSFFAMGAITLSLYAAKNSSDFTANVDPRIGTGGHGHVFFGANVPFGLVQLGPSQTVKGWDWCSGYHESDKTMLGFSHTHLSGTGIGDLGDVLVTPSTSRKFGETAFSHNDEICTPGYYKVSLPQNGVTAELTATNHTGMHRYVATNPKDSLFVRINLKYGIGWDNRKESSITQTSPTTLSGKRRSLGWAPNHHTYFAAEFSRPAASVSINDTIATLAFAPSSKPLLLKVGISAVSEKNARLNLTSENPGWDFDKVRLEAKNSWNDALGRVQISTSDDRTRRIYYTALYHSMFAPVTYSDVNGQYRGADNKIHTNTALPAYSIFSLWDTYRAAHPFYSLVVPEKQEAFAKTFTNIYRQQGRLPVWHLHANETDCMVGNPGAIVLADLFMKGFAKDSTLVYEALRQTQLCNNRSLDALRRYGYIPYDAPVENESVAKGLEYAIADDAVAKVAKEVNAKDDYNYFNNRSKSYKEYYDKNVGFMRGKSAAGLFRQEKYSPFAAAHREDDYCEGNGWQYLWLVPHDPHGLIALLGGEEKFMSKLDSLFIVQGNLGADASPDISGLIGQYAHGNEPSHHILYLYNYAGKPYKAAPLLRKVLTELYDDKPDGLCGNEDVGQMSSWYLLSALGLYQVEPVGGKFVIGSPVVDSADLKVGEGKIFRIVAENNSSKNIYVQSASLNGKPLNRSYLNFKEIQNGGELRLQMGDKPSDFGIAIDARP